MTNFNKLTNAQAERLAYLCEEAGEVIQAANKVLRHGYLSRDPSVPDSLDNMEHLSTEMGQLILAISLLTMAGDVPLQVMESSCLEKSKVLHKWMHHQPLELLEKVRKTE